jgi:hypothetical protein
VDDDDAPDENMLPFFDDLRYLDYVKLLNQSVQYLNEAALVNATIVPSSPLYTGPLSFASSSLLCCCAGCYAVVEKKK